MATIDNLNIEAYKNYALLISLTSQIDTQLRLSEASNVQTQTTMVNFLPKLTDLDLVLGITPTMTNPFAYFKPPEKFKDLRRNPFASFRIAPSFGSLADQDRDDILLESIPCPTPQDQAEKESIRGGLGKMRWINMEIGYVKGKAGSILQA